MLQRSELDLRHPDLAGARGAVVRTGQLEPSEGLSYWLCTHWPTCRRMAAVSPAPEERFAANLRRHRKAARLTQEQLSAKAGLHPTEISRLERAVRDPRLSTIVSVARGLGVSAEQLVTGIR
jgi:DNA-binding XRE family transcriptional regulator